MNIDADSKGRSWSAPYATTFHESGHAIDGLAAQLGTPNGQWHFSSTYKGGAFPQTIKDEVNDWVDRVLADMKAHKDDFPYWYKKAGCRKLPLIITSSMVGSRQKNLMPMPPFKRK